MRWSEEVLLLWEEMRRVLQFLEWHAHWWEGRQTLHDGSSPELAEGMSAYACKQANIRRSIRTSFKHLWHRSDEFKTLGIGANDEILDLQHAAAQELLEATSLL
jgi:hypothetical protein